MQWEFGDLCTGLMSRALLCVHWGDGQHSFIAGTIAFYIFYYIIIISIILVILFYSFYF